MARLNKSARGKHRWVGIESSLPCSIKKVKEELNNISGKIQWKLLDFHIWADSATMIVKVPLERHHFALDRINEIDGKSTITSSGKLRLVRHRISEKHKLE